MSKSLPAKASDESVKSKEEHTQEKIKRELETAKAKLEQSEVEAKAAEPDYDKARSLAEDAINRIGRVPPGYRESQDITALTELIKSHINKIDKKRLAKRKFIRVSPDSLFRQLSGPNGTEKFERKYEGKFMRWKAKYVQKGLMMADFYANAGRYVEMSCDFDSSQDGSRLEGLRPWQRITVEGRFKRPAAFGAKLDRQRVGLVFDECIIR
jgi:hypothetical protein